jgi:hypothetical protein
MCRDSAGASLDKALHNANVVRVADRLWDLLTSGLGPTAFEWRRWSRALEARASEE